MIAAGVIVTHKGSVLLAKRALTYKGEPVHVAQHHSSLSRAALHRRNTARTPPMHHGCTMDSAGKSETFLQAAIERIHQAPGARIALQIARLLVHHIGRRKVPVGVT